MHTITNQTTEASLGAYFVDLFKLDVDQFHLSAQQPCSRDCDFLNRPYELSDLMQSHRCRSLAALTVSALPPKADMCSALVDVCFGPIADICSAKRHVRFAPKSGHQCIALLLADDLKYPQLGIDFYFGTERDRFRNFLVKSRKHGQVSKGRTLH
jgi:hypothetical protein